MRPTALAALMAVLAMPALQAQDMRTLRVTHSVNDSLPLRVNIQYGVGTLTLQAATRPVLYDVRMVYPADHSTPLASYDPATHTLALGIKDGTYDLGHGDSGGVMHVQLARGVPLDLSLKIGAAEATLQLGGLAVRSLTLKGGATQTTLRFDSANAIRMESMDLEVGAAEFQAHGLANARADHIAVKGAAGEIELWFDGTWTSDMTLDGKIYLGDMKIHVPPDIQVLSTAKALLGDVSDAGPSHAAPSDTGDMSDSSDMNNMSDDDSDSSAAPKKVQPHPHPQPQAQTQQPHTYTLRVTGAATVGSLEILHDAGASSSH